MTVLAFFVFANPFFLTAYWLLVLFAMTRTRGRLPWSFVVGGVVLFAAQVVLAVLYRAENITVNAAHTKLGEYLLQTSFFTDGLIRYAQTYFVSAIVAAAVFLLLLAVLRLTGRPLYDMREAALLAVGTLMAGWPAVFLFLGAVFCLVILAAVAHMLFAKRTLQDRFLRHWHSYWSH